MNNQVATRSSKDVLKGMLDAPSVKKQFEEVLKENASAFLASLLDLYSTDNYLQKCEPKAVVFEALKAAVLKLPINKSLGFAYIVPFKDKPTMMIGYKGLIQLAMRTGQYKFINADLVYEGEFQKKNKLTGEFDINGEKTSDVVTGYFAYIQLLNGFSKTLYMSKEQVTNHAKKYSQSYSMSNGAWTKEFDGMALKTVLRNLLGHYGYLSVEMVGVVARDIETESVEDVTADIIHQNANKKTMSFEHAEEINEDQQEQQNDDNCPI